MKEKLKTVLKLWQETVFAVPIGLLLIEMARWIMHSQTIGLAEIFLVCWFLPLLFCLIGQVFWKNRTLAITLSVPLGLSSISLIFAALYGIFNSPLYRSESSLMFIIGVVLIIAAFKMPTKYDRNKAYLFEA